MSLASEIKTLYHLTLSPIRGATHAERLESFYRKQAASYDDYRKHLLGGRQTLYDQLPTEPASVWVEMGGGTGFNLEYLQDRIGKLDQAYIVDLSESLLQVAQKRIAERNWKNVATLHADATTVELPEGKQADVVTFSYSLTMIPDWFAALERATRLLKPGGTIGVVDFYVSRKYPAAGHTRHSWLQRTFWPAWFANDNVYPSTDHVPFLHRHFEPVAFSEHLHKIRYLPLARVPYYVFVGKKRTEAE